MEATCKICTAIGEVPDASAKFMPSLLKNFICSKCADEATKQQEAEDRAAQEKETAEKRRLAWLALCPPRYQTATSGNIHPTFAKAVDAWSPKEATGIGFISKENGTGKSLSILFCLKKALDSGLTVARVKHVDLPDILQAAAMGDQKAIGAVQLYRRVDVLGIDDIGKQKKTDNADAGFFSLIDERFEQQKPTIWTTNAGGQCIADQFGPDKGGAILRRLTEFTTIVKI